MKIIVAILFWVTSFTTVSACSPMGAIFGEITFIQDSINPLRFYFKVKTRAGAFCSFQTDTCAMEWSCPGTGYYGNLPLVDTIIIEGVSPQFPVLIYGGWHTFDSVPPDSLVYASFITFGRAGAWNDGDPTQTPFVVTVTLNLAYLAHHTGVKSAYFNAPMKAYGVAGQVMYFDPQIQSEPDDSLWVTLTPPENDCNSDAGFSYPNQYMPSSHNVLSMYNPTGFLIWDSPPLGDASTQWDIAYLVSGYRNGIFAYSIMRDMLIDIKYPSTTGISSILDNQGLKCYPSPSSGSFTIDMTGCDAGEKQISIYNQIGQSVYTANTSNNIIQINGAEKFATGVYIVEVRSSNSKEVVKIVISQ